MQVNLIDSSDDDHDNDDDDDHDDDDHDDIMTNEEMDYAELISNLPEKLYSVLYTINNIEKNNIRDTDSNLFILSYIACKYLYFN